MYRSENKILGWYSKRFIFSVIKLQKGELMLSELFHRFVKYFFYALFILMPLFALLLKIFYRKCDYFYSEFLVFSIYFHTFIFGVLCIYVLLEKLMDFKSILLTVILFIGLPIYLGLSLKRVFNETTAKTIFKSISLSIIYFLCLVLIFTMMIVASFV